MRKVSLVQHMMQTVRGEGKYYIFEFKDLKEISEIDKYFEISPKGNWENKIILIEKEKPPKRVLDALKQIRLEKKPHLIAKLN